MPLLFYVASTLLTGPAASTDNERAHSVGGRVVSNALSLVGDSVDRNTVVHLPAQESCGQGRVAQEHGLCPGGPGGPPEHSHSGAK